MNEVVLDENDVAASTEDNPTTAFPTTLADLTFHLPSSKSSSNNTTSIYSTLSALRKSTLSIPNRLKSVLYDAEYVQALHNYLTTSSSSSSWPLIPNERSGSWPLDPSLKLRSQGLYLSTKSDTNSPGDHTSPVSAYFKSTDGHINQWYFSPRRLNLPVLSLLGHSRSAVLIDTTRRGKSYPDALRRTVPIWCAVWNRVLFSELESSPPDGDVCSFQACNLDRSEVAQIEARIPAFVKDLQALGLDLAEIKARVRRPIRCLWVVQPALRSDWRNSFESLVAEVEREVDKYDDVNVLVCCSASKRVVGAEMSEDGYVQGAGDDSEGWSHGLTAQLFWKNKAELMSAVEVGDDMEDLVERIVLEKKGQGTGKGAVRIAPTNALHLAAAGDVEGDGNKQFDLVVDCNVGESDKRRLCLGCKDGKLGSKMLRGRLPIIKARVREVLVNSTKAKILVLCSTGRDLSVGVILAILCCFFDDQGHAQPESQNAVDKQFIRRRLAWITSSKPDANPSRATLQAVNSFLMDRPD